MVQRVRRGVGTLAGISVLLGGVALCVAAARAQTTGSADPALEQKVTQYIREKFGLTSTVKLTAQPLRPFSYPAFDEMPITIDDGKKAQMTPVFLTKDRHYLIMAALYPLGSDVRSEIVQRVREQFKVPEITKIVAGPLRISPYPNFLASTVTLDNGKQKQSQEFYVTRDHRLLVLGSIFNLVQDPRQEVLRTISLQDQPSQGPARAPVTIVEYADLECAACAAFHGFLETQVLPKYAGKVRLVFKEFPLVAVHDWSLTAAIANECAYQINPMAYVPFRSLVFQSQLTFNAANARDLLLNDAEQVGVDRVRMAGCLDAKASLPRIERDLEEGKRINIRQTPTCFVNGKMIVGMPPPAEFFKEIDDALARK